MKKISKLSLISLFIIVSIAGLCFYYLREPHVEADYQVVAGQGKSGAVMMMLQLSDEERREAFKSWAKNQYFFLSEAEASKMLPFKLKLPKSAFCGELKGIYVSKETMPEERTVKVFYQDEVNGISLRATWLPKRPNYEENLKKDEELFKSGVYKSDKPFVAVRINGLQGFGVEPGYNLIEGEKIPRPGFISWWDHGVCYELYGTKGEKGTSLQQLLEIAESMY